MTWRPCSPGHNNVTRASGWEPTILEEIDFSRVAWNRSCGGAAYHLFYDQYCKMRRWSAVPGLHEASEDTKGATQALASLVHRRSDWHAGGLLVPGARGCHGLMVSACPMWPPKPYAISPTCLTFTAGSQTLHNLWNVTGGAFIKVSGIVVNHFDGIYLTFIDAS